MFLIKAVKTKKDWNDFINLPWKIYQGNPNWVPPLQFTVRKLLDVNSNPFFKNAEMHPLLVYQGSEPVGRIVGIISHNHNRTHHEQTGFFGFFESINNENVAALLFNEVSKWLQSHGMRSMRGPMNPSVNHECGLLVDGFYDPPAIMMTFNPPYYIELLEKFGFSKAKDLFAYQLGNNTQFANRILKHSERIKEKQSVQLRPLNTRNFDHDLELIFQMTNDGLENIWGAVPMTREEFLHSAKDLKSIVDPRLVLFAELRGKPIGYGLALPDINQALIRNKSGKLYPTEALKLLWNLKGPGRKSTINRVRIILLCVKQEYQSLGIGPVIYTEYLKRCPEYGYMLGEASFVVEDNKPMNRALEMMNGKRYKSYRIYEKSLQTV